MSYILTLVATQNSAPHTIIAPHLQSAPSWTWLAKDKAIESPLKFLPKPENLQAIRKICDDHKTDLFITAAKDRRKTLLLADMDSTIVIGETLDDLAAHAGIKDKIAAITARAMNGELDFHDAIRSRVALLKDLPANTLDTALQETHLNKGAKALVQTMKAGGATCVLISGGFTAFTKSIAAQVGFHHHHGNTLGIENNRLTGQVIAPILDKTAKLTALNDYAKTHAIDLSSAMTIGDGANDLPMLLGAHNNGGLGIGYYAKPSVASQLTNIIRHGDLSAALYAQGYTEDEMIF